MRKNGPVQRREIARRVRRSRRKVCYAIPCPPWQDATFEVLNINPHEWYGDIKMV